MITTLAVCILFRMLLNKPLEASSTSNDKPADDEFKGFDNLLKDVILLNRTLSDKFSSEIEDIRKLAESPIELRHWPRLKKFYQGLIETLQLAGVVGIRSEYELKGLIIF